MTFSAIKAGFLKVQKFSIGLSSKTMQDGIGKVSVFFAVLFESDKFLAAFVASMGLLRVG